MGIFTMMMSLSITANAASQKQKALKAYANFMASEKSNVRFGIAYIDNDSVPELIRECNGEFGLRVYTYKSGKVQGLYSSWDNGHSETNGFAYYPKKSLFRIRSGTMIDCFDYYTLKNGKETIVFGCNQEGEYYSYQKGSRSQRSVIFQKDFEKQLKKLTGSAKLTACKYYKNTSAYRKKILGYAGSVPASIKLNKSTISVKAGKTIQLKATVTGKSSKVTWSSGNQKYATVNSSGKVTGKKAGKVTIYAKANGKTAKCTVTIKKAAEKTLTKNQAIKAMQKYFERYTHKGIISGISYVKKSGDKYCFSGRSYTGAQAQFYIYASNGKMYGQWKSPVTYEWDKLTYVGSAYSYL